MIKPIWLRWVNYSTEWLANHSKRTCVKHFKCGLTGKIVAGISKNACLKITWRIQITARTLFPDHFNPHYFLCHSISVFDCSVSVVHNLFVSCLPLYGVAFSLVCSRTPRLHASDFLPGNADHIKILKAMGVEMAQTSDGRIQLTHSPASVRGLKG